MAITLSREQYRELLINAATGAYIREAVAEERNNPDFRRCWDVVNHLLEFAKEFRSEDMTMQVDGKLILSDHVVMEVHGAIEEFLEDELWALLVEELAFRDLERTLTPAERLEIETEGIVPDRADLFYEKYSKEFETHGLERLEIVESPADGAGS